MKMPKNRRAFALVLVLIALVISSSMAVFFLTSVARERLGVNLYATGAEVHHLAGMPVSQVIGLINAATKEGLDPSTGNRTEFVSWASQPGMIRTYNSIGAPKNVYKLYSWDNTVEDGSTFNPEEVSQIPPSTWRENPALYVDINQPVNDIYPIVDPRLEGSVDGFSIDEVNGVVGGANKAPMPVKWLYVLEDGKMVAPSSGSGKQVDIPGASATNPIIGRVAYWTDDETSKVNINTASEGSYWDVPRSGSRDDVQFAGNPPVNNEFQRTPGHPAMTSLSAVFPKLVAENALDPTRTRWGTGYGDELRKIYEMSPRIEWGLPSQGSKGGTLPISIYGFNYGPAKDSIDFTKLPQKITLDSDRLYVQPDELWFKAPDPTGSTAKREVNEAFSAYPSTSELQRRLFFLTSSSRAPETTLFETPRVSLWPITWPNASSYFKVRDKNSIPAKYKTPTPQDPNLTKLANINPVWITAQERLLAFCASLNVANENGGDRYYFQRKDPDSPVNDWENITRNRDLVNYLIREMSQPVPGYGASLQDRFGASTTAWISLNTLDYIRSYVNQYTAPDAQEGVRYSFAGVSFRRGRIGGVDVGGTVGTEEPNAKMPVPLRAKIDDIEHHAIGTYPVLEEVALAFYAAERREPVPPPLPSGVTDPADPLYPDWRNPFLWTNLINFNAGAGYPVGSQTTKMRGVLLLDFTGLEPGVSIMPTFWVRVRGASFKVNGSSIGLPTSTGLTAQVNLNTRVSYSASATPLLKTNASSNDVAKIFSNTAKGANVWRLVSDDISVNPDLLNFDFGGSSIVVEVYACDPTDVDLDPTEDASKAPGRKVYEKTMDFSRWSGTLPIPIAPRWSMASRAYRFASDGNPLVKPAGLLPGGMYSKTNAPTAVVNMARFQRVVDGTLPEDTIDHTMVKYDLWQPNPAYGTIPNATHTNTTWAWSEYAPMIGGRTGADPKLPDIRVSSTTVYQNRNRGSQNTTYVYRTSKQLGSSAGGWVRNSSDPDDARESGLSENNFSTNFRKRVQALPQRNSRNRTTFCLEGHLPIFPSDHQEWNDTDGNPNNPAPTGDSLTNDFFIQTNDSSLQDSLPLLTPYDTVISMVNVLPGSTEDRDPRLTQVAGNDDYQKITVALSSLSPATVIDAGIFPRTTSKSQWHGFGTPGIMPNVTGYQTLPMFRGKNFARSGTGAPGDAGGDLGGTGGLAGLIGAEVGSRNKLPDIGDWTSLPGRYPDGGRLIRPDQEYAKFYQDTSGGVYVPYWPRITYGDFIGTTGAISTNSADLSYFSPNRQIPSPVLFGALPSSQTTGWQTLAFCPNPANAMHPGLASPTNKTPDHLLLDLFWMPIAEPYPISDQLSTAGKVNLNYPLMPFPYIERKTALYALMKNTWLTALTGNDANIANYKSHRLIRDLTDTKTRYAIDIGETLKAFDVKFKVDKNLFRSASQICEMVLFPKGQVSSTITNFWALNYLTSDNAREQPYNDLYSRVTTKSNTFTVHWRVQSLRKSQGTDPAVWDESRDRHVSELRGSTLIERYIDPNTKDDPATISVNEGIPDYATDSNAKPLTYYYKWRIVSENYFQP